MKKRLSPLNRIGVKVHIYEVTIYRWCVRACACMCARACVRVCARVCVCVCVCGCTCVGVCLCAFLSLSSCITRLHYQWLQGHVSLPVHCRRCAVDFDSHYGLRPMLPAEEAQQ